MSVFFAFAALTAVFFMALTVIENGVEDSVREEELRRELDRLLSGNAAIIIYTGGKKSNERS